MRHVLRVIDGCETHRRKTSAPHLLVTSAGIDSVAQGLGHLRRPCSSTVKPQCMTALYGAHAIRAHAEVSRRRLEPTAMLIGALKVHVGRERQALVGAMASARWYG